MSHYCKIRSDVRPTSHLPTAKRVCKHQLMETSITPFPPTLRLRNSQFPKYPPTTPNVKIILTPACASTISPLTNPNIPLATNCSSFVTTALMASTFSCSDTSYMSRAKSPKRRTRSCSSNRSRSRSQKAKASQVRSRSLKSLVSVAGEVMMAWKFWRRKM